MSDYDILPDRTPTGSKILDEGFTPSHWIGVLADRNFEVSERAFRQWANDLGACYRLGRAMLVTTEQFDLILESRRRKSRSDLRVTQDASRHRAPTTTDVALERLKIIAKGERVPKEGIAR